MIKLETKRVIGNLTKIRRAAIRGAEKGMAQATREWMKDAIVVPPFVPVDSGRLRGSGSAFVNNRLISTSRQFGRTGTPVTQLVEIIPPGATVGIVVFNTPYAAYQHEGVRADGTRKITNYRAPGSGGAFLGAKMTMFGREYFNLIVVFINKEIAKAVVL